jgi:hypothetical protein
MRDYFVGGAVRLKSATAAEIPNKYSRRGFDVPGTALNSATLATTTQKNIAQNKAKKKIEKFSNLYFIINFMEVEEISIDIFF